MSLLLPSLLFNTPSMLLSCGILYIRIRTGRYQKTPFLILSQVVNILGQSTFLITGIADQFGALNVKDIRNYGAWEKLYTVGNLFPHLCMLLIWIMDILILEKFKVLDERITKRRIQILLWSVVFVFFATRILYFVQTYGLLTNNLALFRSMRDIPMLLSGVGGLLEITHGSIHAVYLTRRVAAFARSSKRRFTETRYFSVVVYLIGINLLDWTGLAVYIAFVYGGRAQLLNNLTTAIIGFHVTSIPITLSKLSSIAIQQKPTELSPNATPQQIATQVASSMVQTQKLS
jgi:hypothetical protein